VLVFLEKSASKANFVGQGLAFMVTATEYEKKHFSQSESKLGPPILEYSACL